MNYREYLPPQAWRAVVQCVWSMEGHASELGPVPQPVLPDGRPEIVLHLGEAFERVDGDGIARQAPLLFAGQLPRQLLLRPTGRIAVVGVRLRPFGGRAVSAEPMHRFTGATAPLEAIAPRVARVLQEVRDATDAPAEAVRLLTERALLAATHVDARLRAAVALIDEHAGRMAVDEVAAAVGLTRRHLERLFQDGVGLSPKRLARIARFQRALQVLESSGSPGGGARTAAACGYADQAHFIRDFTRLAGVAPGQHLIDRCELTGFFSTGIFPSRGE